MIYYYVFVSIAVALPKKDFVGSTTGGKLRNGVNGFLSFATDSVRFSQQIPDKEEAGTTNEFTR